MTTPGEKGPVDYSDVYRARPTRAIYAPRPYVRGGECSVRSPKHHDFGARYDVADILFSHQSDCRSGND